MPREAPPINTIYTGMLLVSVVAVLIGSLVLALEMNSYDWAMTPPPGPGISLPSRAVTVTPPGQVAATPPVKADAQTVVAAATDGWPSPVISPPVAVSANPVSVVPQPIEAPAPKPAEAMLPVSAPPAKPVGLIPSPFKLPGGR